MTTPAYCIDGRPVGPPAFYAAACDPARSVVVEACAGAGKTWMLVSRILRALLAGAEPSQILAITFTRKAAGEMRDRLDQWLRELGAPASSDADRVQALLQRGLAADEARRLAPMLGGLQAQLLSAGRPVQVQTFHGWFAQLLSGAPLSALERLGLTPGLQLLEDPEPHRPELERDFHRAVDADAGLRADYSALVRRHGRATLRQWLDAAWQRGEELAAADAAGTLDDAVPPPQRDPAAAMLAADWRDALLALAHAMAARHKKMSDDVAAALVDALAEPNARLAFERAWSALMTQAGEPRKKLGDLPAQAEACTHLQALRQDWRQQDAHEDHHRMARLSRALLAAYRALKRRHALADMGDLERAGALLLTDPVLSGWVQARLDLRVRHLLIDEFQDTSPQQWQALRSWLAAYAGAGGGSSGQAALSVFIVGDPKQSIYRFRRAEPRVFTAACEFVQQALDGQWLTCDHTRRNAPEVLAVLNGVFEGVARDGSWPGFRPHTGSADAGGGVWCLPDAGPGDADAAAPDDDEGAAGAAAAPSADLAGTAWRPSLSEPRDAPAVRRQCHEAEAVAALIADLIAGCATGCATGRATGPTTGPTTGRATAGPLAAADIMVLARRRSTLARVADALAARGLPYTVPEAMALGDAPEALDLIALLDVLASPGHGLSLARALRSPLFDVDDAALVWLSRAATDAAGWWTVLTGEMPLPTPALVRARRLLQAWAEAAARLPPHDLLDRIVHEGELVNRLAAALPAHRRRAGLQAVDALLAAALQLEGGRYATPYAFVRALRRVGTDVRLPAPADAVRLLTVHGAKGLEARAVVLVDADPARRSGERATLLVDWPAEASAPACVAFVASETHPPPSLQPLLELERQARERESLNGLYVAMTRAREWLFISRTPPHAAADLASWWSRVQPLVPVWERPDAGPAPSGPAVAGATVSVPDWPVRVPPTLQRPPGAGAATGVDPAAASAASAALGRAVHRLLEWIGRPDRPLPRAQWPTAAQAAARAFGLQPQSQAAVLDIAARIIDSPECAPFFDPAQLVWAGNEVPVARDGEVLRIDRLVALRGHGVSGRTAWWVLDYKLAGQPLADPDLRKQLQGYCDAVRMLQPGEPVHGAFITGGGRLLRLED